MLQHKYCKTLAKGSCQVLYFCCIQIFMKHKLLIGLSILFFASCNDKPKTTPDTTAEPLQLSYTITATYPHNTESFTEGLEYRDGFLYEGTGDVEKIGKSKLAKIDLKTGKDLQKINLEPGYFGEGITLLNGKIYQMTWQENKCFLYDAKTFTKLKEFSYEGEGWGLTNDGKQLIMSNGSCNLYFRDPETFAVTKTIAVNDQFGPLPPQTINELEYVDGFVYANIWQREKIVKIDLTTGKVVAEINFSDLLNKYPPQNKVDVLNGIAYDSVGKRFFITGKYYPQIFEVKLN